MEPLCPLPPWDHAPIAQLGLQLALASPTCLTWRTAKLFQHFPAFNFLSSLSPLYSLKKMSRASRTTWPNPSLSGADLILHPCVLLLRKLDTPVASSPCASTKGSSHFPEHSFSLSLSLEILLTFQSPAHMLPLFSIHPGEKMVTSPSVTLDSFSHRASISHSSDCLVYLRCQMARCQGPNQEQCLAHNRHLGHAAELR